MRARLSADSRRLIAAQALRAAGYGFTAVLIGALLAARAYSTVQAGILLGALVAGTAGASLLVGAYADRVGRRRAYVALYLGLAAAGAIVAAGAPYWLLLLVALTGLLSTDVVDNGPATTLEQAMLAAEDTGAATSAAGSSGARVYGVYNAVASLTGAFGALAAAVPSRLGASGGATWPFLVLVPIGVVGAVLASRLSAAVEGAGACRRRAGRRRR